MTLKHGVYVIRTATLADEVATALTEWQPHLALLDMDLDGADIMALLGATPVGLQIASARHPDNRQARPAWRQPRFIATVPGRGYRFLPTFTDDGGTARAS